MDPITLILTVLAASAAAIAKGGLSEAGKDAYRSLEGLIRRKFGNKPQSTMALAEYEKDPETWEKPLRKALSEVAADRDEEILRTAQKLMALMSSQQLTASKYITEVFGAVHSLVQGDNVQVTINGKPEEE